MTTHGGIGNWTSRVSRPKKLLRTSQLPPLGIRTGLKETYSLEQWEVEKAAAKVRRQRGYDDGLAGRPMQQAEDCLTEGDYALDTLRVNRSDSMIRRS
jgi:hypothetical protein